LDLCWNCVEVSVLDEVDENLQNQKHSVVKETICIRLASIEKISHAKEDPRRSSCQFLSNIVEASKDRRSLGTAPQQPSKPRSNMLNKLTASDFAKRTIQIALGLCAL
jgi:hypothetical protein